MKKPIFIIILMVVAATGMIAQQKDFPKLTGPYLGQKPPGMTPEIFAPGIVSSSEATEYGIAFTPDGKEFYFNRGGVGVMVCTLSDTGWAAPVKAPFLKKYKGGAVHIMYDGKRLLLNRYPGVHDLKEGESGGIWALQKTEKSWDNPLFLIAEGMRATSTLDGTIYTTDISGRKEGKDEGIIAKYVYSDSGYQRAADPDGGVNTENSEAHPFIAPDESYIIFDSTRPGGRGKGDLYICFRFANGSWSQAFNSTLLNTAESDWCATVSPDGKYLFFTRNGTGNGDIYWVDANIIENIKPKELRLGYQDILRVIQKGDVETVKTILSENPDSAKIKDKWGRTPLHFAVDINNVEIIECLIGSGADVDATDIYAWTPLFRAIDKGKKEAAQLLISKGADVNYGMEDGFRAVHLASSVGNPELLELLLKRGADQNAKNRYGLTPLHIAAAYGLSSVIELLLSYKTDMNAKSIDRRSPFHFAQAGGHRDIADLIRSKGGNAEPGKYPVFKGKYLGFEGPGQKPEIFLPGILRHLNPPHNGLTISPDAKEIYWSETSIKYDLYSSIWFMKEVDGFWTPLQVASFSSEYLDTYPCFSVDGKRIFFSSNRPLEEKMEPKDCNIWYVEKTRQGWSQPKSVGSSVNTDKDEEMPTIDKDGTLYYSRSEFVEGKFDINIYRSRCLNGRYGEPEKLEETVNSSTIDVYPFIAPDGSYLIYNTSRYGIGFQLCISFLKKDGSWTEARPMKELLGPFISWCQGISPDGQYLFFAGHKNGVWDIYWVDAKIIKDLKPKELK